MNDMLKKLLCDELCNYKLNFSERDWLIASMTNDPQYMLWKFHKLLRYSEYYYNKYKYSSNRVSRIIFSGLFLMAKKKRNKMGNRLSVDIRENSFEEGLVLFHNNIVVNGHARVGKNCRLHGNNVIGNDGKSAGTPRIGDNVDIGAGAVIIGAIDIADNIKIGAGSVVNKSFTTPGVTLAGIPAREIRK